jgi:NADH:ubiquinone oxidoreductase subunit 3 (subunit A)
LTSLLMTPPLAFLVILAAVLAIVGLFSRLSAGATSQTPGKFKAYACGEDIKPNRARPEYGQFFPFAFFFTIMHVVALVVATIPRGSPAISIVAMMYVTVATVGLLILYRS